MSSKHNEAAQTNIKVRARASPRETDDLTWPEARFKIVFLLQTFGDNLLTGSITNYRSNEDESKRETENRCRETVAVVVMAGRVTRYRVFQEPGSNTRGPEVLRPAEFSSYSSFLPFSTLASRSSLSVLLPARGPFDRVVAALLCRFAPFQNNSVFPRRSRHFVVQQVLAAQCQLVHR